MKICFSHIVIIFVIITYDFDEYILIFDFSDSVSIHTDKRISEHFT